MQTCIHAWVGVFDIANKVKKKKYPSLPVYSLALDRRHMCPVVTLAGRGLAFPPLLGHDSRPAMCQNQSDLPPPPPRPLSFFLYCGNSRDVRDRGWQSGSPQTRFGLVLLPSPQCSTSVRSQSFTRNNKYFGCYSHICAGNQVAAATAG